VAVSGRSRPAALSGRYWIGKYREDGRHKTKLLSKVREITKSQAQEKFAEFLKPLIEISPDHKLATSSNGLKKKMADFCGFQGSRFCAKTAVEHISRRG
jgi:hypothetical protein